MDEKKETQHYKRSEQSLITTFGRFSRDPKALQEIGHRLVTQAVQNVVEERMGQKMSTPMVVRKVAKGEAIPSDLLGQADIVVGPEGLASSSWERTWLNLAIWNRSWSESERDTFIPTLGLTDLKARFRLEYILTPDELAVVDKLKIGQ